MDDTAVQLVNKQKIFYVYRFLSIITYKKKKNETRYQS